VKPLEVAKYMLCCHGYTRRLLRIQRIMTCVGKVIDLYSKQLRFTT
jgi:hypothetical protein